MFTEVIISQIEIPIVLDSVDAYGVMAEFEAFAQIVSNAINLVHKVTNKEIAMGDPLAKYRRDGIELVAKAIEAMMPVDNAAYSD